MEKLEKNNILFNVKNLKKYFPIKKGILFKKQIGNIKAVDGISFQLREGETLGLVGESGCGKSTAGLSMLQLLTPTSGDIIFRGTNLNTLKEEALRKMRKNFQMIFQDPYSSLNPRMTVGNIIGEPLKVHNIAQGREVKSRIEELLVIVGLNPKFISRYPHEFSGGQRQRIGIARSLALNPSVIVADEPISALDVSIQGQIINLLVKLQEQFKLTYLFIAHDLAVVRHISNRVAVMYLGKIVELSGKNAIYKNPLHPYTRALLSAAPLPDPEAEMERRKKRTILLGDVPNPANPPAGCNFCSRCPEKRNVWEKKKIDCNTIEPSFVEIESRHWVACHLY